MTETEAFAILSSIPHLGSVRIRLLLNQFGSASEALKASTKDLHALGNFEKSLPFWNTWQKERNWQQNLELVEQSNVQLIPFTSSSYPKALLSIADPPALLYVKGNLLPKDCQSLAIVGTRQASLYGKEMAENIAQELASNGFTVLSGLARGIDTAAHQGALKTGRTIAVIGSGLSLIYPSENQNLANSIAEQGALISEFPMQTPPDRQNFPQRNRIVSGMAMGTLLIEAPLKSGAMITMNKAYQYRRKLFALPGRADNENFHGNHSLIKSGKAQLVENAQDIFTHFQDFFSFATHSYDTKENFQELNLGLDKEELTLFQQMPIEEIAIDDLYTLTSLPIQNIHRILMGLVLKKKIKEFPGKIYKKLAAGNTAKRHN